MKAVLPIACAALLIVGAILLGRLVLHLYTDHGHFDFFHSALALAIGATGMVLLVRELRRRVA